MIELLNLWQLQSANVAVEQNLNSLLIIYLVLSIIINRPVLLLAYLSTELLFQLSLFDSLPEWNLYAIECIIYTYVFTSLTTNKSKYACLLIITWSIYFICDAYCYGDNGLYGGYETILYKNIEFIFTSAHLLLVFTLIPFRRIWNSLRDLVVGITGLQVNGSYMLVFWYNVSKSH